MPTDLDNAIQRAHEYIADAAYFASTEDKRKALLKGITEMEEQALLHPDSPEPSFSLGYLWYHWPDRTTEVRTKIYALLQNTLKKDQSHINSKLYLGFLLFDDGRYQEALGTFLSMDQSKLGEAAQSWPRLKAEELTICCKLRLDHHTVTVQELDELRKHYTAYKQTIAPPAPVEITRTALALREYQSGITAAKVNAIISTVEAAEGVEGGPLASELLKLREWLGTLS